MIKQNFNSKKYCNFKVRNHVMIFSIIILVIVILPSSLFINDSIIKSRDKQYFLETSAAQNYSGEYDGGISTMGMKINFGYANWSDTASVNTTVPYNSSYYGLDYSLNRLDILTLNMYNGSGPFSIAENFTGGVALIDEAYILAQEFTTDPSPGLLAIDTINLRIAYLPGIDPKFRYYVYICDENFTTILAFNNSERVRALGYSDWKSFKLSSNILEANKKYNIVYFIARENASAVDGDVNLNFYETNSWISENKTKTHGTIKGLTRKYNGTHYVNITAVDDYDMLCNFTFQNILNPESINLTYSINDEICTPIYQKSLRTGALGYEALLIYNFNTPPIEDINITVYTDGIRFESCDIILLKYYVYTINTSGTYNANEKEIEWTIYYPYTQIGDLGDSYFSLFFLYETDWQLEHFYNTLGSEVLEVFFGPMKLFNISYYVLFDLWKTPMEIGTCMGIFHSPNYCNNINTKVKIGDSYENKGTLQLGKTIKLEAEIRNVLDQPISGGNGTLILKNPEGQVLSQWENLRSNNGILSSSDYYLDTSYGVGIYTVDIFWTNGREVAIYTITVEVGHPEGYIPPETIILIVSLIGMAILATPATLVVRKYARQRNWEKHLRDLFVLTKQGVSMYNFSFGIELRQPELISGMISALTTFMKEATGSKEGLRTIDQQDKKIILNHGNYTTIALISDKDLPIIHKKVKKFTEAFENKYGKLLFNWSGEVTIFKDAESIVKKFFPVSIEEQKIRGAREKLLEFRERLLSADDKTQIISIMREITDFSSRYQQIINNYSFKEFNELIQIAEHKINE